MPANGQQRYHQVRPTMNDSGLRPPHRWEAILFPRLLSLAHLLFRCLVGLWILSRRALKVLERWKADTTGLALRDLANRLPKKPRHIAFALQEPTIDIPACARLLAWSAAFGLSHVSLYDHRGIVKARTPDLYRAFRKLLSPDRRRKLRVRWRTHGKDARPIVFRVESNETLPLDDGDRDADPLVDLDVSVLSHQDGQDDVVRAADRIAEKLKVGSLDPAAIDETLVGSMLITNQGMPDPDLLIRFGLTSSNLGFLPWHIRLTEIHDHVSHTDVDAEDLFNMLCRFSKCEQRFGK